jgi:hypothetical protein
MIGFFTSKLGLVASALVLVVVAYLGGLNIGHSRGYADAVVKQSAANEEARLVIRERIQDALETAGANSSPDDVDRLLLGLSGLE